MSADAQTESLKIGAVIYLASNRPLHRPDFLAEFHKNWPLGLLEKTGKEMHRAFFRAGRSNFALEMHHTPVPQAITDPVIHSTLHWPMAAAALAHHPAYFRLRARWKIVASSRWPRISPGRSPLCWLNGPALNPAKRFATTAREIFDTGLYPLALWVATHFDPEADALHTKGMEQFGAPEI